LQAIIDAGPGRPATEGSEVPLRSMRQPEHRRRDDGEGWSRCAAVAG